MLASVYLFVRGLGVRLKAIVCLQSCFPARVSDRRWYHGGGWHRTFDFSTKFYVGWVNLWIWVLGIDTKYRYMYIACAVLVFHFLGRKRVQRKEERKEEHGGKEGRRTQDNTHGRHTVWAKWAYLWESESSSFLSLLSVFSVEISVCLLLSFYWYRVVLLYSEIYPLYFSLVRSGRKSFPSGHNIRSVQPTILSSFTLVPSTGDYPSLEEHTEFGLSNLRGVALTLKESSSYNLRFSVYWSLWWNIWDHQ